MKPNTWCISCSKLAALELECNLGASLGNMRPGWNIFNVHVAPRIIAPSSTSTMIKESDISLGPAGVLSRTEVNFGGYNTSSPAIRQLDQTVDWSVQYKHSIFKQLISWKDIPNVNTYRGEAHCKNHEFHLEIEKVGSPYGLGCFSVERLVLCKANKEFSRSKHVKGDCNKLKAGTWGKNVLGLNDQTCLECNSSEHDITTKLRARVVTGRSCS